MNNLNPFIGILVNPPQPNILILVLTKTSTPTSLKSSTEPLLKL